MMKVTRFPGNPILTPDDVPPHRDDFEVIGVFNAGVVEYGDEIIMVLRIAERPRPADGGSVIVPVWDTQQQAIRTLTLRKDDTFYDFSDPRAIKYAGEKNRFCWLTSISYLRLARSLDGIHFSVDPAPFVFPETELEAFGVEDPRVTRIGETYYITYSAVSPRGIGVGLASTEDFVSVRRHGLIFAPENKDVVLFPEPIHGKYYALHRPVPASVGAPEVWIAESHDLIRWGNHRFLFGLRPNHWDEARIGAGAVPIKTSKGWLELYHGADRNARYSMGAILLDLEEPWKVVARTEGPVLEPETAYETQGFFGNVVFSCGALLKGDIIQMYYGVSDSSMAYAEVSLEEVFKALR